MQLELAFKLFLKNLWKLLKFRHSGVFAFPSGQVTVDFEGCFVLAQRRNSKLYFFTIMKNFLACEFGHNVVFALLFIEDHSHRRATTQIVIENLGTQRIHADQTGKD